MSKENIKEMAAKGDIEAQCSLAAMYERGEGVPRDFGAAAIWWQKAASKGHEWAKMRLAELVTNGKVKESPAIAEIIKNMKSGKILTLDDLIANLDKAPADEKPKHGKKILVVDDEEGIRDIIRDILERGGYRVIEAANGQEALKRFGEHVDIKGMILDLNMPKMNGFQFLKMLRVMKAADDIPILVCTSHTTPETIEQARKLKVSGWVVKPFENKALFDTVKKLVEAA